MHSLTARADKLQGQGRKDLARKLRDAASAGQEHLKNFFTSMRSLELEARTDVVVAPPPQPVAAAPVLATNAGSGTVAITLTPRVRALQAAAAATGTPGSIGSVNGNGSPSTPRTLVSSRIPLPKFDQATMDDLDIMMAASPAKPSPTVVAAAAAAARARGSLSGGCSQKIRRTRSDRLRRRESIGSAGLTPARVSSFSGVANPTTFLSTPVAKGAGRLRQDAAAKHGGDGSASDNDAIINSALNNDCTPTASGAYRSSSEAVVAKTVRAERSSNVNALEGNVAAPPSPFQSHGKLSVATTTATATATFADMAACLAAGAVTPAASVVGRSGVVVNSDNAIAVESLNDVLQANQRVAKSKLNIALLGKNFGRAAVLQHEVSKLLAKSLL